MVSGEHASDAGRAEVDGSGESDSRALVRRQLGAAIRRRRHAASLTLATVSERAGISVSMLSQVERGLLDPSLDTLRNIADALGTAPFRLLAEEGPVAGLVRRGERRIVTDEAGNRRGQLLSPSAEGAFAITVWELQPGESRLGDPRPHAGEEANLLLQGAARLEVGDELIDLATGDCATFDQRSPHRVTAVGRKPVIVLSVVNRPEI
jgi:transcriptional regulator with XRE-family HTH domain